MCPFQGALLLIKSSITYIKDLQRLRRGPIVRQQKPRSIVDKLRQYADKYSKLRFHDEQDMLYSGLYIAETDTPDASIWNTESGAAYTLRKFGVMRTGVAANKFD